LALLIAQHEQVKAFHFLTGPGCFAQELQAGTNAGFVRETADGYALTQIVPAIKVGQSGDDGFEREAVQRVARLRGIVVRDLHDPIVS